MPSVADVSLRGLPVAQNVPLETSGDGDFLGLAEPVPVGTLLTVTVEGRVRTARVTQVVEREPEHSSRPGVHLAWLAGEAVPSPPKRPTSGAAHAQTPFPVPDPGDADEGPSAHRLGSDPAPEVVEDFHTARYGEPPSKKRGSKKKK